MLQNEKGFTFFFNVSNRVFLREKGKHSLKPSFEVDHRLKLKTMCSVKWLPHAASQKPWPDDDVLPHAHTGMPCFVRFSMANQANHTLQSNSVSRSVGLSVCLIPAHQSCQVTSFSSHLCPTTSVRKFDFPSSHFPVIRLLFNLMVNKPALNETRSDDKLQLWVRLKKLSDPFNFDHRFNECT